MIKWFERHYVISWVCVFLIGSFIFYVSSWEFAPVVPGPANLNAILYHIIAFFFFTGILSIALVKGKKKSFLLISFLIALGYGVLDEIHQYFVPGRCATFDDVFLDLIGISFAILVYWILIEMRR